MQYNISNQNILHDEPMYIINDFARFNLYKYVFKIHTIAYELLKSTFES